jgi:hypothetical protein
MTEIELGSLRGGGRPLGGSEGRRRRGEGESDGERMRRQREDEGNGDGNIVLWFDRSDFDHRSTTIWAGPKHEPIMIGEIEIFLVSIETQLNFLKKELAVCFTVDGIYSTKLITWHR